MSSGEIVISGGTDGNSLKKTPVNNKSRNKKKSSRPNSKTASSNNEKVVPLRKKHYADMNRLNRLYKSHDAAMRKRFAAKRLGEKAKPRALQSVREMHGPPEGGLHAPVTGGTGSFSHP